MEWASLLRSRCADRGDLEGARGRLYRVNDMNRTRLGLRVLLALLTLSLALSSTAAAQLTREQVEALELQRGQIVYVRPTRQTVFTAS